MAICKVTLQKIVFPQKEHESYWELFYRSPRLFTVDGKLQIPANFVVDFATYLNGFPYEKWNRYTGLDHVSLKLKLKGKCRITLTGYTLAPNDPIRTELGSIDVDAREEQEIELIYPAISDSFVAFEIGAFSECVLLEGDFNAEIEEGLVHPVNLAVATTTFRKEDYIRHNIRMIREQLLEGDDPIKDHLFVNVVDNGRTLKKEEIESRNIRLFYNENVGGSGGYSRGMIESMHMQPAITNVLLMDDDVLVLPESIRRLYTLLRLLKPDYQSGIVSGAMLELDRKNLMVEDIGFVMPNRTLNHLKPVYNVGKKLEDVLSANREIPHHVHTYAGWWFCCIPASVIRDKGLPMPFFIRMDDVEYGLRAQTKFLTMSGICVWHMGFGDKFNSNINFYQEFRNCLIVKDATSLIDDVDVLGRWKQECLRSALTFDYKGWELLLLAFEDYMKGPSYIEEDHGTELLKAHKAYAEKMAPLSPDEGPSVVVEPLEKEKKEEQLPFLRRAVYYLSYNGQRFVPEKKLSDALATMRYDWDHRPASCGFHKNLLIVNPFTRSAVVRHMDRAKFRELLERQKKDLKIYQKKHSLLEKNYKEAYPYMVSEEFWRKYLKLDQKQG